MPAASWKRSVRCRRWRPAGAPLRPHYLLPKPSRDPHPRSKDPCRCARAARGPSRRRRRARPRPPSSRPPPAPRAAETDSCCSTRIHARTRAQWRRSSAAGCGAAPRARRGAQLFPFRRAAGSPNSELQTNPALPSPSFPPAAAGAHGPRRPGLAPRDARVHHHARRAGDDVSSAASLGCQSKQKTS